MPLCFLSIFISHNFIYIYSRKRILELEDTIEPVQCLALSPVPINGKGKPKKNDDCQIQENISYVVIFSCNVAVQSMTL